MDIWISYASFDISTFEDVTYWSRDYVTISFMWIFELTNDIGINLLWYLFTKILSFFHRLDIWFGYGYLNYLKNIWFIIVDIWPGKPILYM